MVVEHLEEAFCGVRVELLVVLEGDRLVAELFVEGSCEMKIQDGAVVDGQAENDAEEVVELVGGLAMDTEPRSAEGEPGEPALLHALEQAMVRMEQLPREEEEPLLLQATGVNAGLVGELYAEGLLQVVRVPLDPRQGILGHVASADSDFEMDVVEPSCVQGLQEGLLRIVFHHLAHFELHDCDFHS